MKKFFGSSLGGLVIGLPLSFWWFGYEEITYIHYNRAGIEEKIVREMDFDFFFNASLLMAGIAIVM